LAVLTTFFQAQLHTQHCFGNRYFARSCSCTSAEQSPIDPTRAGPQL